MCVELAVRGIFCTNLGEIEAALGGPPVLDDGYGETAPNHCLCSVDMEATAKRYGLVLVPDEEAWMPPRMESQ